MKKILACKKYVEIKREERVRYVKEREGGSSSVVLREGSLSSCPMKAMNVTSEIATRVGPHVKGD